jgi:hypothetical protein
VAEAVGIMGVVVGASDMSLTPGEVEMESLRDNAFHRRISSPRRLTGAAAKRSFAASP